ncbi:MAG TPA: sigma-70 family RNA polymerase sigma factor [Spirochaetota bacterium]|nr:sigma-70 family RNA polymerase sigma factor [Spirochaetota bacterium]HOK92483.1 sigma-70 family RNA polymerase sigma factor [Spirochaetota bacterium]HON15494.1 sigma-70 family RNA polymerase sigma factor [Spirochaetota bacterium]HPP95283.1 sigma-70 family RNA polymerase sigma factor [Spirochaetota bacterium]HRU66186.1 sigma-70 family RNA polymerase sigma factor [Spirochaetota bacterium]
MIGSDKNINQILLDNISLISKIINTICIKKSVNLTEDEKEDIFQNVCVNLLSGGIANFRGECKFETYLFSIIFNEIKNYLRKIHNNVSIHQRSALYDTNGDAEGISLEEKLSINEDILGDIIKDELYRDIFEIAASLKKIDYLIFKLYFIDDKTQKEVAEMCKRSQATISERIVYIQRIIRSEIIKRYGNIRDFM